MQARAVVMVGPRRVEVQKLPVPDAPPRGGAIIKVLANGLCGTDYETYLGHRDPTVPSAPTVPGHEVVGRIVALDSLAEHSWAAREGDRVAVGGSAPCGACGPCRSQRPTGCVDPFVYSLVPLDRDHGLWGGMAEYMVLMPGTHIIPVPTNLCDEDAALCNTFGNAFEWASVAGGVGLGDRVLIMGAGQRGLACAAVAREAGAAQIIITGLERDVHKLALAPHFGATDQIQVDRQDTVATVRELTNGEGVDLVVDGVPGNTDTIIDGIELLRPEGTLVLAGIKGKAVTGLFTDRIFRKRLRVHGANGARPWATSNAMRVIASGRFPIKELHTHTVGLDEVEWAIQLLGGEIEGEVTHITVRP